MNVMHMKVKHILLYFIKISFSLIVKLLKYTWISPNQFYSCIHSSNLHLLVIIVCIVTVCTNFCDYLVACADGERGRFIVNALYKCLRIAMIPYVIWSRKKNEKKYVLLNCKMTEWFVLSLHCIRFFFFVRYVRRFLFFGVGGGWVGWIGLFIWLFSFGEVGLGWSGFALGTRNWADEVHLSGFIPFTKKRLNFRSTIVKKNHALTLK